MSDEGNKGLQEDFQLAETGSWLIRGGSRFVGGERMVDFSLQHSKFVRPLGHQVEMLNGQYSLEVRGELEILSHQQMESVSNH